MATFNPPPNWPQPPANWKPDAGWRPDPAWGPAPEGWQLWVEDTPAAPAAPREKRIFISYRRSDVQPQANAINDGLRHRMPGAKIFMDIDSIPVGVDFEKHVKEEIEVCDVVLVVIGDDWLTETNRSGERRIDDPNDFVRLEVEAALDSPRVSVVPVLVEGAEMPTQSHLPESIRGLARINAIELSDRRWTADIERLAVSIRELEEHQQKKAQRQPGVSADSNGPIVAAPAHVAAPYVPPTPPPAPAPMTFAPAAPSSPTKVGNWMIAIPILSCGLLACVPSFWVASQRKSRPDLMKRAILIGVGFIALEAIALVLIGLAPEDGEGTASGPLSSVGAVVMLAAVAGAATLAAFQRNPAEALRD